MKKSIVDQIHQDVKDRQDWAAKQELYYRMRNGGVRRSVLPFTGASDLWYPLGDTMIEKLKPAYVQQLYGGENIATFVALKAQDQELTSGISGWFDYMLKQETNFERAHFTAIDQMLECGFCPVKVRWDAGAKKLCFDQIDPLHLIVPQTTQEYNENGGADRLTHVLHMSVDEYKANGHFTQEPDLIKKIKGKGGKDVEDQSKSDSVDYQEGINCSANTEEIVLWEVYVRDRTKKKITVYTVAPLLPEDENEVRNEFVLPYNKGCFAGGDHFPFYKIRAEIKGKGYYSSRGIIQINAPFEASLTQSWNSIHDHLAFSARPNYENTGVYPIPSGKNFTTAPGSILPPGLKMAVHPPPPPSIKEDMDMTRAIAEDRTQIPDLGASEHLTGTSSHGKPTATQINAIVGQSGQGTDMRARVFRMDEAVGLKMAWSIYLQYKMDAGTLQYLSGSDVKTVDQAAVHDEYNITPNGSADSWNKGAMVAKAMAYYDKFISNPFINKGELTKMTIEVDDPQKVKRLYEDPGIQSKDQEEQQVMECLMMDTGYTPQVHESDDDKVHLAVLDVSSQDKLQKQQMTPEMAQQRLQHGISHMGALKAKKDRMLKQVEAKLQQTAAILAHVAQQPGPQQQSPSNVVQMQQPGQADQSQGQAAAQAPGAATPANQDKPSAVMNALAALIKAGAPITTDDLSTILAQAGLPPLPVGNQIVQPPPPPPPQGISPSSQPPAQAAQ